MLRGLGNFVLENDLVHELFWAGQELVFQDRDCLSEQGAAKDFSEHLGHDVLLGHTTVILQAQDHWIRGSYEGIVSDAAAKKYTKGLFSELPMQYDCKHHDNACKAISLSKMIFNQVVARIENQAPSFTS